MSKKQILLEFLLVIAIFLMALAVRTYRLDEFPPGLYNDEAAYAMDGLAVLHGEHAVFFERNNGREPLFIYLLALVFNFLGATPYTVRLTAALVGAVTVVSTYWMVRAMFRFAPDDQVLSSRWFAAWAALFLAFSYWHLSFSRLGFRAITLPLIMTVAFALLWMTWRRLRQPGGVPWAPALATGVALGLTVYTYTAGRMAFVLFLATVVATTMLAPRFGLERRRPLLTAAVVLGTAMLTAMPLVLYFVMHPAYFAEHAAEVSIFNPRYSGGDPLSAFGNSLSKTLLMFFNTPDRNPRHNPAQIPVFDPLLAIWLAFGLLVACVRWRRLTTSFSVMWFVLFIAPAILSGEGIPHSLRTIGLLPIVYVLPLFGMAWIIERTPGRFHRIMRWLPAPFLALAAFVALNSYFGAWGQTDRFRPAFFVDFVDLAYSIQQPDAPSGLWILPLPETEELSDGRLNTIDFLMKEPDNNYATLLLDEATIGENLATLSAGRDKVFVLQTMNLPEHRRFQTKFADTRGMLDLFLRRNSIGKPADAGVIAGIPYKTYQLVETPEFALPKAEQAVDVLFDEAIRLDTVNLGAGQNTLPDDAGRLTLPADAPIWVALRWQAQEAITTTLKTSLFVQDESGAWVTQLDGYLAGGRYPLSAAWLPDERSSTYHVIDLPPGLAPGRYTLNLRVYEDENGTVYSAQTPSGEEPYLKLANMYLLPPLRPGGEVSPQFSPPAPIQTHGLELLGYDLPVQKVAPGDSIPLTLYLHAPTTPTVDYELDVALRAADGPIMAQYRAVAGSDLFPTHTWRAGEVVRIPVNLRTDPDVPNGSYALQLAFYSGGEPQAGGELAQVEIQGRPRLMAPPPTQQAISATFDDAVQLLGVNVPDSTAIVPGEPFTVTLLWQPLKTEARPLVRFAQFLDDGGRLVAQQDTIPCDGACPASGWLAGEYLLDTATLMLPPDLSPGPYTLITGWYDSDTQQRLPARDDAGQTLQDDAVRLPLELGAAP